MTPLPRLGRLLPRRRPKAWALSATINFFDGEELLDACVRNIRPHVEHLSIVWQVRSNVGLPISPEAVAILRDLEAEGLVDDSIHFEADIPLGAGRNEFAKRAIGLARAKERGATHMLLMDVDEFYNGQELEAAKAFIQSEGIDYSTVRQRVYIREPTYRIVDPVDPKVSFIGRIGPGTRHEYGGAHPVGPIDPTRTLTYHDGRHAALPESVIVMHHMSGVRRSFASKLANTSCRDSDEALARLTEAAEAVGAWQPPGPLALGGSLMDVEVVADQFGIGTMATA